VSHASSAGITKAGGCKIFMQISNREDTEQSPAPVGVSLRVNTDAAYHCKHYQNQRIQ